MKWKTKATDLWFGRKKEKEDTKETSRAFHIPADTAGLKAARAFG